MHDHASAKASSQQPMVVQRTASASKRKASPVSEVSDGDASSPLKKKSRTGKKKEPILNGQPTNTVMPVCCAALLSSCVWLHLSS